MASMYPKPHRRSTLRSRASPRRSSSSRELGADLRAPGPLHGDHRRGAQIILATTGPRRVTILGQWSRVRAPRQGRSRGRHAHAGRYRCRRSSLSSRSAPDLTLKLLQGNPQLAKIVLAAEADFAVATEALDEIRSSVTVPSIGGILRGGAHGTSFAKLKRSPGSDPPPYVTYIRPSPADFRDSRSARNLAPRSC